MSELIGQLVWIALGGAAGGVARFAVTGWVSRAIGEAFPWGTLVVNGTGAAAVGGLAACFDVGLLAPWPASWPLLVMGFLASYTTVSSVSLQTLVLVQQGRRGHAAGNLTLSLAVCLSAVAAGYGVAVLLLGRGS
jgi:fluoride exporter